MPYMYHVLTTVGQDYHLPIDIMYTMYMKFNSKMHAQVRTICTNDTLLGRAKASPIVVTNTTNSRTCVCTMYVQCNLDCPDLVYPEPQLSQKIHYYACTEGVINDLLWMWLHID